MGFVVLRKWTAVSQTSWINPPNRYSAYFSSVPVVAVVVGDDIVAVVAAVVSDKPASHDGVTKGFIVRTYN